MSSSTISFSVFTKPWKTKSVWQLAQFVKGMGFDGIEFPLREGYQLEPAQAEKLPQLVAQFADHGLKIFSVASGTDEHIFAACAEAGVPMIRVMPVIRPEDGYLASVQKAREQLEALAPLCEKYGVKIGCQQHYGNNVTDATGLKHLLDGLNPDYLGAVWDAAHDALAGQQPEFGLDIVWSHLGMVNFKNAYYKRTNGPEAEHAEWKRYFTSGRQGLASWPRAAAYLQKRNYDGVICLTAEYTNEEDVARLIQQDIAYAKSLFA
ncbi:sugar phosphate isomerase/epimerase family protein [Paenibacillus xerothermodurans]|uniref:Sugar phosphate isomerase/epimerase n=1 Tax=Paenibacillus xerothermodurans TaxID=1977292 RepID=A0A2W1NC99_PAEXE|nr:sugar phosphate isomerase/epimerase family protein [Paenibacillus xerothermodurans]PZE22319.1 sugar phosphate isomerase/epimerase [Paenibacillus xerothermodurans]